VEASQGREELPAFWLRVALAEGRGSGGKSAVEPALLARCAELLARFGGGGGGGGGSSGGGAPPLGAPPNAYIRKLFDGYSAHFDAHLVGVLGYRTPDSLRALAARALGSGCAWAQAADLGCGTGLAGVAFRALVRGALDGCDLSPGMVGEAQKRPGLYRELQAAEVVEWLRSRSAAGVFYDLVLSADVLVYIGGLEALFEAVAASLAGGAGGGGGGGGGAGGAPPAFLFSTEAMLEEGEGATFELTATGRCRHSAAYIRRLAGATGLAVVAHSREAIRENAGRPVEGDLWLLGLATQ
jgi:predicted TPR repeat methyltransferase